MGLFFSVSDKKLLEVRNKIFLESAIPALLKNGFEKSPFSTSWYGRNNLGSFTYQLCRLSKQSELETITTEISKGDSWIKIFLNIFILQPKIDSIATLNELDGMQFDLPPNSISSMRLRLDDRKGPPIFHLLEKEHKIHSYYSEQGFDKQVKQLSNLLQADLNNINYFVARWHDMYPNPQTTDWGGHPIQLE